MDAIRSNKCDDPQKTRGYRKSYVSYFGAGRRPRPTENDENLGRDLVPVPVGRRKHSIGSDAVRYSSGVDAADRGVTFDRAV